MKRLLLATAATMALMPGLAAACDITVGLVLELTGPAGE
jgi:branched-chain amino acid transport system substrate-binding protein